MNAFASGEMAHASFFWTFAPMNKANCHWWQSITGEMPASLPCTEEVKLAQRWPGCDAWAEFWDYKTNGREDYSADAVYSASDNPNDRRYNVICIQDFQQKYDSTTGSYSRTMLNKGHWGENSCYPGAEKVMRGVAAYFETPMYNELRKVSVS